MRVTIFCQYEHDVIAKALKKIFVGSGVNSDLLRLSSALKEEMDGLECDTCLFLLPSYWEIQSSFLLPLFRLVTRRGNGSLIHQQTSSKAEQDEHVLSEKRSFRKCIAISVGTAPFIRPCLGLNLVEIFTALRGGSHSLEFGAAELDGDALLDVVEPVTAVVRHCREPKLWAEYLEDLSFFSESKAFHQIQAIVRTSLASANGRKALTRIADFLDVKTRETVLIQFFPSESKA